VGAPQVNGNKATDTVLTTNDFFLMIGVAPVQFTTEATIDNGKITSFVSNIVPSEGGRVAAAAKAFQAAHAAPAPTGMPQTGTGAPVSTILLGLLMMALFLVTAGLVLRRSRSRA
jgi:LPXTG-motif cell wall-anchored protein